MQPRESHVGRELLASGSIAPRASLKQLMRIPVLKDYWFDWKTYNPGTSVYTLSDR